MKKCFIITPIGEAKTEISKAAEGVIDSVIEPVLSSEFGYKATVANRMSNTGSINRQVITSIIED